MEKTAIEDVPNEESNSQADVVRLLAPVLDTTGLAINYFEVAPTESIGYEYHRHLDQEEVFYVQQGTITFDTESGDIVVNSGEIIRFDPGEFQLGRNLGSDRAQVLAIGAPRESAEIEYLRACPNCEEETIQVPTVTGNPPKLLIHCTECESIVTEISP